MKKGKIMLGLTVAGAAVFAFASCAAAGQGPSSTTLSSRNDVLGMGAVTTVELLGTQVSSGALQTLSAVRLFAEETGTENTGASTGTEDTSTGTENTGADEAEKTPAQEQAETFNKYFSMLDSLLGDDVITTEVSNNTDEGYEAYAYKLVIKGKDMKGEDVVHLMYYNETEKTVPVDSTEEESESGESAVQTASKHFWEVKKKKHENETKTEYVLEGVMVVDETDYILRGERSVETEEDETENEIEIRAYLDETDVDTFVRMKQEISVEENETEKEYVYSVVKDGKLIEQTAVEFETEKKGDREDVQYELEFRNGEGRGRYCVERKTKDGESFMRVSYRINGQRGVFFIHQTQDGQYEYTFENGKKERHEGRDRHEVLGAPRGGMPGGMQPQGGEPFPHGGRV